MENKYSAIIRPLSDKEGGGFLVEYPELKGCMADGNTPEEALKAGEDAVKSWLLTAEEFGDNIPQSKLDYSGQISLRMPTSLHGALAHRAAYEKVSLNALINNILAQNITHPSH